jgi:small conductance mechanosensitive channel
MAGYPVWLALSIALAAVIAFAYLVGELVARLVRAVFLRFVRGEETPSFFAPFVRRPLRAVRLTVFATIFLVLLFPALKVAGMRLRVGFEPEAVVSWLLASGVRIAIILLVAALVMRATGVALRRIEEEVADARSLDAFERAKRVRTLGTLVENVVVIFVVAATLLMVLRELNVDILPLLTGAGIAGLAIGFGAQTLVKDVISGFFLILENQLRVGDVAVINGTGGVVESVRLRTIILRDVQGAVHVIPNGSINTLSNLTKDFSYALLDVSVAYKEDTDQVTDVLKAVGEEVHEDPRFQASILAPLEILGVEAFGESAVTIRIRMKTLPLKQWDVARELRRRIKRAFDSRGIEIPFPHRTLHIVEQASLVGRGAAPPPPATGESTSGTPDPSA